MSDSIAKQFAFKEFMRGCIKCLFKIQYVSTVSKNFKINLEGQNYVHFEVILSRNVKLFGIMAKNW